MIVAGRPVRVTCDENNGYLLPFARKKLGQLWAQHELNAGVTKAVVAGPTDEQIEVSIVGGIGRITIRGGAPAEVIVQYGKGGFSSDAPFANAPSSGFILRGNKPEQIEQNEGESLVAYFTRAQAEVAVQAAARAVEREQFDVASGVLGSTGFISFWNGAEFYVNPAFNPNNAFNVVSAESWQRLIDAVTPYYGDFSTTISFDGIVSAVGGTQTNTLTATTTNTTFEYRHDNFGSHGNSTPGDWWFLCHTRTDVFLPGAGPPFSGIGDTEDRSSTVAAKFRKFAKARFSWPQTSESAVVYDTLGTINGVALQSSTSTLTVTASVLVDAFGTIFKAAHAVYVATSIAPNHVTFGIALNYNTADGRDEYLLNRFTTPKGRTFEIFSQGRVVITDPADANGTRASREYQFNDFGVDFPRTLQSQDARGIGDNPIDYGAGNTAFSNLPLGVESSSHLEYQPILVGTVTNSQLFGSGQAAYKWAQVPIARYTDGQIGPLATGGASDAIFGMGFVYRPRDEAYMLVRYPVLHGTATIVERHGLPASFLEMFNGIEVEQVLVNGTATATATSTSTFFTENRAYMIL